MWRIPAWGCSVRNTGICITRWAWWKATRTTWTTWTTRAKSLIRMVAKLVRERLLLERGRLLPRWKGNLA